MARFFFRHWTGTVVVAAILGWAVFYLPGSPTVAVLRLKLAIDARDADAAAQFVDFESVVKNAGKELVGQKTDPNDILGRVLGEGAVALFSGPAAGALQAWAKREVETGAREVQMPAAAVAGSVVLLHRDGDSAYTKFTDHKRQTWEIHMARNAGGQWQIVEVKNVAQLLEKLRREEEKRLNTP
jgi:DUF2939 family protein